MSPLTVVSGYWAVTNKHGTDYNEWFKHSLRINAPYVFFGTKETIELVKPIRGELPTHYIELELAEFHTQQYKEHMITHPVHCPSAELNMIWNEKVFLIKKVATLNPFGSEWFAWVDAGTCTYRTKAPPITPFPNSAKLATLPHNKFLFTSSDSPIFQSQKVSPQNYYHNICGTAYMLHGSTIDNFASLYDIYLKKYLPLRCNIFTDQLILTYMYKEHPTLFHQIGHGYGAIVPLLY